MHYSSSKEFNKLIKSKIKDGWLYQNGKKHGKLIHLKTGLQVAVPCSPSDRRALLNFTSSIKKLSQNKKTCN